MPQGFTYAIASADYRGFAALQSSSAEKASYYFQGSSSTAAITHPFRGPYNDNWQSTDVTDWAQLVWAPCGVQRNFNINTELRVNAGTSTPGSSSFMTMDSTDGDISTIYHLAWKECPPPDPPLRRHDLDRLRRIGAGQVGAGELGWPGRRVVG